MAHHAAVPVKGQCHITVGAFDGLPAGTAGYEVRISPAVDEEHDLFLFCKPVLHQFLKAAAEDGTIARPQFLPQVHDFHLGKAGICLRPLLHGKQAVFPPQRLCIGLQGRGGRTEDQGRMVRLRPHGGSLPGVIPRGKFAFVGIFMLLIYNDEAKV